MKKTVLLVILALLLACGSTLAGTGPQNIAPTPHNLSSSGLDSMYAAFNEDQICIYCHTPHGGTLEGPLWNRDMARQTGAGVYTHYTSSTLSSAVGASNRAVNNESLLCLSCHDGSIGVGDNLINNSGVVPDNNVVKVQTGFGVPGPRIGASSAAMASTSDLSDDHPISFSYSAVLADKPGTLQAVAYVETTKNLVLFGGTENVECATCHDPHVNYLAAQGGDAAYDPFLAIPNAGSDMCLACHIK